jgi:hypothetical protein
MKYSLFFPRIAGVVALGCALGASTPIANTGYITVPALVSAGMANVMAYVPAQAGASYRWTITGGTIPGVTQNAAVVFTAGAAGTATVQCVVSKSGVQAVYTQAVPVAASLPVTSFYYGSGFSADSLANTVLGGPSLNSVSYRFQAKHASALRSIRLFFIWSLLKTGYQAGQGGTVQVDLLADDGSAAHLPTGPSLATLSYGNIIAQNSNYPKLSFPTPAILAGGRLYHLVFTNVDPSPMINYISLDSLYTNAQTAPMQPSVADADFALLVRSGASAWKLREGFTPIVELDYADGGSQGNGYMEVWSTNPKTISGNAMARETFQVSGPSRAFTRIMVRLQRTAGTSPLTLRLETSDGTLIEQGTVPAASVLPGVPTWVECSFPLSQSLASGADYHLTLSSPADTQYSIFPIRKGLDKGFSDYTAFPDGHAQYTTSGAAGWTGWDMWGTLNLTTSDLQFMFVP